MSKIYWSKAPEGATHAGWCGSYCQFYRIPGQIDEGCYDFWSGKAGWHSNPGNPCARPLYARPVTGTAWDGQGQPPVGTVCEFKENGRDQWAECTIIGEFQGRIICGCHSTGAVGWIDLDELRPIRTPEQLAAEDREKAIDEMHALLDTDRIPHLRKICEALHAAGYRKPEAAK